MMPKKILICSIALISMMIYNHSSAITLYTEIECFKYVDTINPSNSKSGELYLASTYSDVLALQNGKNIDVIYHDSTYKHIPFKTNISQGDIESFYENIYSFGDLDTNQTKEIILEFEQTLKKNDFYMNFIYDSKYYTPKFHISEDSEASYSQVLRTDIADYSITHIKIIFEEKGSEPIREVIKIPELSVLNKNTHISLTGLDKNKNVLLYAGNSCGQTRDGVINATETSKKLNFIQASFSENSLYKENITDSDKDGISDLYDNCKRVKNPDQKDVNQNSVGDACEFDSDKDTIPDEIDNCRNIANTDQSDDDRDNIGNTCDNCDIYNPSQTDTDNNGIGDVCDSQTAFLIKNDDDSDGVLNSIDNCRKTANPDQLDDDNDGIGNTCDNCKSFQNYNQTDLNDNGVGDICEDSDNDGIDSINDNCINTPNPDQSDDDNDGIGNVCEDDDNDTIIFSLDNCPYTSNSDQRDTDSDGLGDVCDSDDNRFLESNKPIFILLMFLVIAGFIGAIFMMMRKLQK